MDTENHPPQLRNMKTHNAKQTPTLSEEIIEEILSRLPVKTLLKFRCVSKLWCSLIGRKRFIKTHLDNSMKNSSFAHHRIILNSIQRDYGLKHCSLRSLLNEPFTDLFTFDDLFNIEWNLICLVGCFNGLVCILVDRKYFILWNPSTKMSKKLPDIDMMGLMNYGFGCDESSDDYKVLATFYQRGESSSIIKLYSLKTNSWKLMSRNISTSHTRMSFASGKLHWGAYSASGWDIVAFDLKSEVFGMVEQPCYSNHRFLSLSLIVLGGCLCILCEHFAKNHIDIWVMNQYGVKESWSKVEVGRISNYPGRLLTPLCNAPSGEILLISGLTLFIFNPKDRGCRRIKVKDLYPPGEADVYIESYLYPPGQADIYIESLVPLVVDGTPEPQPPEAAA